MPVHLYLAPAASGKTAWLVDYALAQAAGLRAAPRVVVPTQLQVRSWKRRLAEGGGALGVRVGTFDTLYRDILAAAGEVCARLSEPIQYRLLRALADSAPLAHYAALRATPGFVQVVLRLVRELKAGGVYPANLSAAVAEMGGEPRLAEMAYLYAEYQRRLQQEGWADPAGVGWLAAAALTRRPDVARTWPSVLVDGFDDLSTVQLRVLEQLAPRVGELIVTLTGSPAGTPRDLLHKRFNRTRQRLEERLGVAAEPLPAPPASLSRAPALAHLEATLFAGPSPVEPAAGAVALIAAPDREGEVRAALRWLKARLVEGNLRLGEAALLARNVEPYRPFVYQTAAEFGLPVQVVDGLPLHGNPAVAALLDLLQVGTPGEAAFPWRQTVEAWRSPYLDWGAAAAAPGEAIPIGITAQDADTLDWLARWASVVAGLDQWEGAFALLTGGAPGESLDEEGPPVPGALPTGAAAAALRAKFQRFVRRITPPEGVQACRAFVAWLEGLVGEAAPAAGLPTDLGVVRRVLDGPADLVERDLAALNALKDVLRGLVWAEEAVACPPVTFPEFLRDLTGAVQAATYRLPLPADQEALLVASVTEARGLPFRAVAILGLAEGEFPATLAEDPLLRDEDRRRLHDDFQLQLALSTDSAEAEYFYEAITRPRETLLLTRPRVADNGAPWQPSPFWEEVLRRVDAEPKNLTGSTFPGPAEAASWPELLLGLSAKPAQAAPWAWAASLEPARCAALAQAAAIVQRRTRPDGGHPGAHDGDLSAWAADFGRRFGPQHVWSASRLETYRTCPFWFFVGSALGLEPRSAPAEGLDARQVGNLYHRILERVYGAVPDPTDLASLLEALPKVAGPILDGAPQQEQFRPTRWWERTRVEIVENVERSLAALAEQLGDFRPAAYEAAFGIRDLPGPALEVRDGADSFRLHGLIDRIDRSPEGQVRIIDYKSAGPSTFTNQAAVEGKKLQLGLYALAAQEALQLGEVVDGFYWHVQQAKGSPLTLRKFKAGDLGLYGPSGAMQCALGHAWEAVRAARAGVFSPAPPEQDCPDYCPAVAFCWRYARKEW